MASTTDSRIRESLKGMTVEQKIAHLIMPEDRGYRTDDWKAILDQVPLACVFLQAPDHKRLEENVRTILDAADLPVLVACDMETGYSGGTLFPPAMGLAAAGDPERTRERSRVVARECSNAGFNWCFNPVVDLALNHNNPETLTRSFGDDPARVGDHAVAQVEGLQADGLVAATAKHFPGAGSDDRDQHLCTAANRLPVDEWWNTYGAVWQRVIEAGVMTIMPGHISFPAYQAHGADPGPIWRQEFLPATLSSELQVDLLRSELGFEGVIVSDAAPMVGIASRVGADDQVVRNILSGGDVYLFADPILDFQRLMNAYRDGRLGDALLDEKVARILALKMALGLEVTDAEAPDASRSGPASRTSSPTRERIRGAAPVDAANSAGSLSDRIAAASITIQKADAAVPVQLRPGSRVLTVTVTNPHRSPKADLSVLDAELRERGFEVEHWENPSHRELMERLEAVDHLFLNLAVSSHTWMGTSRLIAGAAMTFWRGWWVDRPGAVTVTSFGSPYHLYEIPSLPNMILCYGDAPSAQRAAVSVWLGEAEAGGRCPVTLP